MSFTAQLFMEKSPIVFNLRLCSFYSVSIVHIIDVLLLGCEHIRT